MKRILILLIIPFILISMNNTNKEEDNMLRVRVIANSNSKYDQEIKTKVSNNLKTKLYNLLKEEDNIETARKKINDNMSELSSNVKESLEGIDYSYTINYGYNHFPEKEYNGKTYKEGNYESLLVTLGKGEGNNWWCILFPPICLLEAEEEKTEEVEYTSFFKTIFDKIIHG